MSDIDKKLSRTILKMSHLKFFILHYFMDKSLKSNLHMDKQNQKVQNQLLSMTKITWDSRLINL